MGRNAEFFEPLAGRLLTAGSQLVFPSVHMHANANDDRAPARRLQVPSEGLQARAPRPWAHLRQRRAGPPSDDGRAGELHFYTTLNQNMLLTTFEPHMHAAGVRMCTESI